MIPNIFATPAHGIRYNLCILLLMVSKRIATNTTVGIINKSLNSNSSSLAIYTDVIHYERALDDYQVGIR